MQRQTAESILRFIAILTIFLGMIMSTWSMITLLGMRSAIEEVPRSAQIQFSTTGIVTELGIHGVVAWSSLMLWGWLFFCASPWLAQAIVQGRWSKSEPGPRTERRSGHPGPSEDPDEASSSTPPASSFRW